MWTRRLRERIEEAPGPVLLVGGEAYGVPYLIEELGREGRLAWMRAGPGDRGDAVAQGNLLAAAANRAVGGELFPSALPYAYTVRALRHHADRFAPLVIALSEAQHVPELAAALVDLHGGGVRVLVDATTPLDLPGVRAVPPERLALTLDEARELAPRGVPEAELERVWRRSGGRMTEVLSRVLRVVGMPVPTLPTPDARLLPPSEARGEDPRLVVRALVRDGRHEEALELAVMALPEAVEELLRIAGPRFQERGLLARLALLLDALPEPYRDGERVLEWRLVAGFATGDVEDVVPRVDAHLEAFAAPDLRARRAAFFPPEQALAYAREAVEARRDALTLFALGRYEPDEEAALDALLEGVRAAEAEGSAYAVARNAGALGERYLQAGRLDEAVTWLGFADETFSRERLRDGNRRLRLLNDLAAARVLLGDVAAVRERLEEAQEAVEGVLPLLALSLRSTLASVAVLRGRTDEARELLESVRGAAPRRVRAHFGVPWALLRLREGEAAPVEAAARELWALSRADEGAWRAPARLLRGLARRRAGEPGAEEDLRAALEEPRLTIEHALVGGLALLAGGARLEELPDPVRRAAPRLPDAAIELLTAGDDDARAARAALRGERAALVLEVATAGPPRARFEGREVALSGRLWEVALMLALHPNGLHDEALLDVLVGETGRFGRSALRTHVSRLRSLLPVSATPYRFTVPVEVDVFRARASLEANRVRDALAQAPGPILPTSTAVGVEEAREAFEEELRQAVLASGDPEALLDLAGRTEDDLELWEEALAALPDGDPRRPIAKARALRLAREYDPLPRSGDPVR